MLSITHVNSARIQPIPSNRPGLYTLRKQAINAAVAYLGIDARHHFEFLTFRSEGGWRWRRTDENDVRPVVKPDSFEAKCSGGYLSARA